MSQIDPYDPPGRQQQPFYGQPVSGFQQPHPVAQAQGPWHPALVTDRREPDSAVVVIAWVLTVLTVGYLLPWAVAATRGKANQGAIALINVLLGWSLIGWIVALVMAAQAHQVVGAPMQTNVMVAQQSPQASFAGPFPPVQDLPAAGWYRSPDGYGRQYGDGVAWTGHRAPWAGVTGRPTAAAPPTPSRG